MNRVWYTPVKRELSCSKPEDPPKLEISAIRHSIDDSTWIEPHRPMYEMEVTTYRQDGVIKEQMIRHYHRDDPNRVVLHTEYRKENFIGE